MNLQQKTSAALSLLTMLAVQPAKKALAQIMVNPDRLLQSESAFQNNQTTQQTDLCPIGEKTRLPNLIGGKYHAELFIHVPGLGDGKGDLRLSGNLMRFDARFFGIYGRVTSTVWTDLVTDISVKIEKDLKHNGIPVISESFIANLGKVPVTKCTIKPYDKDHNRSVTIYHVDHQQITGDHAFDGDVAMDQYGRLAFIRGRQKNTAKCGTYKPIDIEAINLPSDDLKFDQMKLPSLQASLQTDPLKQANEPVGKTPDVRKRLAGIQNQAQQVIPPTCGP